jgi:hypothetical protein
MQTADRVRQILLTRGLTLYQVSRRSAEIFGHSSPYYIPQGLYSALDAGVQSPNIYQLAALSRISGYRLSDWLAVFGFRLDEIPRVQLHNSWRRTVVLDSTVYDLEQWIPWFQERLAKANLPAIAPLRQVLKPDAPWRARDLLALDSRRFLYARIGRDDVFAFPDLAPGSIARIDVRPTFKLVSALGPSPSKEQFLVENGLALHCGHLRTLDKQIVLCSTRFPFPHLPLTLGRHVRILGLVDAEIRSLAAHPAPRIASGGFVVPKGSVGPTPDSAVNRQQLLRLSRLRAGISFREASAESRWIARAFRDQTYFAAPGTLSDYENTPSPLRHVQKILSLCMLYCIDFWSFLRAEGVPVDALGPDPLPEEMVARTVFFRGKSSAKKIEPRSVSKEGGGFLSALVGKWEELPLFLISALPEISGLKNISPSDIFWVGGNPNPLHPCLVGASLVAVNRRVKMPSQSVPTTVWEQPLYILLRRDGAYFCGACILRQGVLTVHPHSDRPRGVLQFKNGIDAEVIGQVTAILRKLP